MSYRRYVAVECDDGVPGTECCLKEVIDSTLTAARRQAAKEGWLVGRPGGVDFCPEHHVPKWFHESREIPEESVSMSASAWRHCPRCTARKEQRLVAEQDRIASLYGTVSVDEFDTARTSLAAAQRAFANREKMFREDYEIWGAQDGTVNVSYGGCCQTCGLSLSFNEAHEIPDWNKP